MLAYGKKCRRQLMQDDRELEKLILKAHREGIEYAIDLSARTGVPLVIEENGKIKKIKPTYKYVRVPIVAKKIKRKPQK
jgi:hypothetical protein